MAETQKIDRYDIVSELGRGGMGVVFKAWEDSLQRYVAIKMLGDQLTQDATVVERFLREARAVADLNHPNVVQVFTVDTHEGRPYFAMEYVEGESLTELIHTARHIDPQRAAQIIKEAANGLAAAHAKDVIHRDIKPDNIMLTKHGGVKVVDFGIAKVDDPDSKLTATGMMVGTPNYISPEVCLGQEVDGASDIFSLGIVFFEMLAGSTPFQADSPIAMMTAVVQAEVPDITTLNPEVDNSLRAILGHMLQKERANRYTNCNQIIEDLDDYLGGKPPRHALSNSEAATVAVPRPAAAAKPTGPASTPEAAPKAKANGLRSGLVIALLLVVGTAVGSWYYVSEDPAQSAASIVDSQPAEQVPAIDPRANSNTPKPSNAASAEPSIDIKQTAEVLASETVSTSPAATATELLASSSAADAQPTVEPLNVQPAVQTASNTIIQETSTPTPTAAPAQTKTANMPPKLVVIARGDPTISGTVETVLEGALLDADFDVLDEQFFAGFNPGAARFDLAGVSQLVQRNQGDILVLASLRKTGERTLSFYGRREQQTLATLEVRAVSIADKRNVGAPWRTNLEYVPLNANDNATEVTSPIAAELVERLQALNN